MTPVAGKVSLRRDDLEVFAGLILDWARVATEERSRLPWRLTTDPWAVLLSEFMLAQTQVSRVAERFPAVYERFPTPRSCAAASAGDVVREWSGLGYNRRALALHRCASLIVERFGAEVPTTVEELVTLPGVGPYTARAVAAFAFDTSVGVVDVNIARLLSRAVAGKRLASRSAQELADLLSSGRSSRTWNLALMDLGSLVCRARTPRCASCPVANHCAWIVDRSGPDPGARIAHQSRFEGSDRQGRGRLLRCACDGPIEIDAVPLVSGWPDDPVRAARVAADLVTEGLLVRADRSLSLP